MGLNARDRYRYEVINRVACFALIALACCLIKETICMQQSMSIICKCFDNVFSSTITETGIYFRARLLLH